MIKMKKICAYLWSFLMIAFLLPSFVLADGNDPFYDAGGLNPYREPLGATDFEHIDPYTGGLTLNFVDMSLPGNNGLDLVLQRFYNSKDACRDWTELCEPSCNINCNSIADSWVGVGWSLHMGKLMIPISSGNPFIEMPDGSMHGAYHASGSEYITREYWKLVFDNSISTWTLTLTDGRKMYFGNIDSTSGNSQYYEYYATKIEDTAGNNIIIEYYNTGSAYPPYAPDAIKKITDSVGRATNFYLTARIPATYGKYRLDHITRPDGEMVSFDYLTIPSSSSLAKLNRATPPEGNPWTFQYNTNINELTEITTPYGGEIDYAYQTTKSTYAGGLCDYNYRTIKTKTTSGVEAPGAWNFLYGQYTTKDYTVVTDSCGRTTKYRHYGYNSGLTNGQMWEIGLPISKEVEGEEKISYDWTNSSSISNDDYYGMPCGTNSYDYVLYVPYLFSKTITRDGETYTTAYGNFDNYGNPKTISETGGKTRTTAKTYFYNATKNIVRNKPLSETVSGSLSGTFTTNYTYDTNTGNLTQLNRYGVLTNYTYYATVGNLGNLRTATDANSKTTTYEWQNGQISKITNSIPYSVLRVINANGTVASETNGRNYKTAYTYDGNLRLKSIDPPAGNPTSIYYPTNNSYKKESRGGYWLQTNFDGLGRPTGTTDSKGVTTMISYKACGLKDYTASNIGDSVYYDSFGRTTKILHKDSSQILYGYSGDTVTVTDEAGKITTLDYTAFGSPEEKMLTSVKDAKLNITTYTRNILGSLTGITQGSLSRSFTFNTKSFLTGESHPETGSITFGRDNVGNMTWRTDGSGTVNFTYDSINRLTDLSFGGEAISFDYDKADNRTSMTSPGATASYVYDAANRMTSQSKTISGRAFTTGYGYDNNDNLTSLTYPKGLVLTYGYNTNNQMTSAMGFGGSVTGIAYNTAGLPTEFNYSNGKNTALSYNTRNMTTQINAGTAYNTSFGYDSRGNTTSITDNLPATAVLTHKIDPSKGTIQTTNYGYSSSRMTSLSGSETATYAYNGRGDMTSLKEDGVTTYTPVYDLLHNLTAYKQGTTTIASYGYDGDGQRVTKTVGGVTTVYQHDMSGKLLSETDSNGNRIADYVYVNGNMAAKVESTGVSYYHNDPAGTPTAITDSTGTLIWRAEYLPFGEEQLLVNTKVNDKMFVAKEKDEETGLYYFGARYMQDRNAHFISVDPVGPVEPASSKTNERMLLNPQQLNRYAYALNNPYRYVDPDGKNPILIAALLIGLGELIKPQTLESPHQDSFMAEHGADLLMMPLGIENAGAKTVGKTVLGKFPQYMEKAAEIGARRFNIPTEVWNKMSKAEQWAANQKFLDRMIKRGDEIILSSPVKSVNEVTGSFRKELEYLSEKGYRLSNEGTKMIK